MKRRAKPKPRLAASAEAGILKPKTGAVFQAKPLPPPNGFNSWLAYAIATMDTRSLDLDVCWGHQSQWPESVTREDFVSAAQTELATLLRSRREKTSTPRKTITPLELRIRKLARAIFTTDEAVVNWLALPDSALGGIKPIDRMKTKRGVREVERLLIGMAHGNVL